MRISINGKNIEVSEYLRDLALKKMAKLERYFPADTVAQVTMAVEKNRHIVEVTIPYGGGGEGGFQPGVSEWEQEDIPINI